MFIGATPSFEAHYSGEPIRPDHSVRCDVQIKISVVWGLAHWPDQSIDNRGQAGGTSAFTDAIR